jgi:hypothetical protein
MRPFWLVYLGLVLVLVMAMWSAARMVGRDFCPWRESPESDDLEIDDLGTIGNSDLHWQTRILAFVKQSVRLIRSKLLESLAGQRRQGVMWALTSGVLAGIGDTLLKSAVRFVDVSSPSGALYLLTRELGPVLIVLLLIVVGLAQVRSSYTGEHRPHCLQIDEQTRD